MQASLVRAFCLYCRLALVFASALCCGRAAAIPIIPCNAELVPGVVTLAGADCPTTLVRSAGPFSVTLHLKALSGFPPLFERDLLVSLDSADIARVPLRLADVKPGEVVAREFELYAPRGLPPGPAELRVGFLRDGAPGEMKREDWTYRRAAACTVELLAAPAPADAAPRPAVRADKLNLLRNGGFDGWNGWKVDRDIVEGRGGWSRALLEHLDPQTFVGAPFALRIDFMGGQDPNFYGLAYDAEVRPATIYTLAYFTRTESLSQASPPCLEVTDADRSIDFFRALPPPAQRFHGTSAWQEVAFTFTTPPETRRLRIKVRRYGSGPTEYRPDRWGAIGGSVWFDEIRLIEGRL